jgi:hypothetical protein
MVAKHFWISRFFLGNKITRTHKVSSASPRLLLLLNINSCFCRTIRWSNGRLVPAEGHRSVSQYHGGEQVGRLGLIDVWPFSDIFPCYQCAECANSGTIFCVEHGLLANQKGYWSYKAHHVDELSEAGILIVLNNGITPLFSNPLEHMLMYGLYGFSVNLWKLPQAFLIVVQQSQKSSHRLKNTQYPRRGVCRRFPTSQRSCADCKWLWG